MYNYILLYRKTLMWNSDRSNTLRTSSLGHKLWTRPLIVRMSDARGPIKMKNEKISQ